MHARVGEAGAGRAYGPEYRAVPVEVMVEEVLARLTMRDVVRGVWAVSRGWRALARHPTLWKVCDTQTHKHIHTLTHTQDSSHPNLAA